MSYDERYNRVLTAANRVNCVSNYEAACLGGLVQTLMEDTTMRPSKGQLRAKMLLVGKDWTGDQVRTAENAISALWTGMIDKYRIAYAEVWGTQ